MRCWGSEHLTYITVLGLPLFLLYVVGIPLAVYVRLTSGENYALVQKLITLSGHRIKNRAPDPFLAISQSILQARDSSIPSRFDTAMSSDSSVPSQFDTAMSSDSTLELPQAKKKQKQSLMSFSMVKVDARHLDEKNFRFYRNYSFLFLGYKRHSYYWEIIVLVTVFFTRPIHVHSLCLDSVADRLRSGQSWRHRARVWCWSRAASVF